MKTLLTLNLSPSEVEYLAKVKLVLPGVDEVVLVDMITALRLSSGSVECLAFKVAQLERKLSIVEEVLRASTTPKPKRTGWTLERKAKHAERMKNRFKATQTKLEETLPQ